MTDLVPSSHVARSILTIRGHKVLLDRDLASLYGVENRVLLQAVRRNVRRFPDDFMIQLTPEEAAALRSQIVISKPGRGGRRYLPFAFTEQGVAMLSTVLKSEQAIQVNIAIMRTFVQLREVMLSHRDLAAKLATLECKYDGKFKVVFDAIRKLMDPPRPPRKPVGFRTTLREAAPGRRYRVA